MRRGLIVSDIQMMDIEELSSAGHQALMEGRTEHALRHFKDALKAADQLQDSRVLQACSFNLGATYVEVGRPQKGLDFLQRAQPGPKADRLPDLQFNLALAHNALGQWQEAAAHFLQAAQLYRSQGDGGSEGNACMEMSHCYGKGQDWCLAAQGFLRAAGSYRVAAILDSAAIALKEAGNSMIQSHQFSCDDVINVLAECLSFKDNITEQRTLGSLGFRNDQAQCFHSLAFVGVQLGDVEEAVESFIHALQGFRDTENHLAQVQVCESLAKLYLRQRKPIKAVQLYKQALSALTHCQRLCQPTVHPSGPHPCRPCPQRSPIEQCVRNSDITHSPCSWANQQPDEQ
ncbi:tetratricopeptide repeat protein 24 isoform X2 [Echeneis naucrates]|uniref:tetratricopeptide repeat protein 24 isoform X2 n=1 Tax=Echeneis naucrates TaxID=173247 RepID=UPI0011139A19|nr:tetratricopeptide repeat protein 24 isoform X2 [Echeneis naucrates]